MDCQTFLENPCVFDETAREMDCFMPALSQPFNGISSFSPLTVQSLSVLMRTLKFSVLQAQPGPKDGFSAQHFGADGPIVLRTETVPKAFRVLG